MFRIQETTTFEKHKFLKFGFMNLRSIKFVDPSKLGSSELFIVCDIVSAFSLMSLSFALTFLIFFKC